MNFIKKNTKNKKIFIIIFTLLVTPILGVFIYNQYISKQIPICYYINQTSKMGTEEKNKIQFQIEIKNFCGSELKFNKFQIVTKEKIEDNIINNKRYIEKILFVKNGENKVINIDYLLPEEEFKKFYRYTLIPVR